MVTVTPLQLVGNTPLLALERCHTGPGRLLAKAEFMMPGGSVKDRAALAILRAARADGRLKPGQTVVEMTSGNMGAGLAVVCAALGHPFVATMSAGNSPARAVMMDGLGARVVLTPQVDGAPGQVTGADIAAATAEAQRIAREERAFYVDQFNAAEGIAAHEVTGAEILRQAGHVDGFVAAVGTGCTFIGIARALKVANPATLCAPVEPEGSEPLMGKPVVKPRHMLQGTSYGLVPPHWDAGLVDFGMTVSDEEVTDWKARLATREGLYVGYSAAANVCAASRLLSSGRLREGATVLTVLCDTGLKY